MKRTALLSRNTVNGNDRLTVTLFLAGLFHLIVILGITFAPPDYDSSLVPTLEVLLVSNTLPESALNENASYLAERTQQGSGNADSGRTRLPGAGDGPEDSPGEAEGGPPSPQEAGAPGNDVNLLSTRGRSTRYLAVIPAADSLAAPPRLTQSGVASPLAGRDDETALELKGDLRRELLVSPSTQMSDVAVYLDAWKQRIEQVGTIHFPNEARRAQLSGNPVIEVALASSGGLVNARVKHSSGYAELDQAALEILKLATPFEAFPQELAARHEVLRFAYEWQFVGGRLAGSTIEIPAPAPEPD